MFIPYCVMLTDDTRHKGNTFQNKFGEKIRFYALKGLWGV